MIDVVILVHELESFKKNNGTSHNN